MKAKLILLNNPIIVSDKTPNKFYDGFYFLDGKLFNTSKTLLQTGCKEVIAQGNQINWNGLESEFGWVDVNALAENTVSDNGHFKMNAHNEGFWASYIKGFITAFQKDQELNVKKFSLDDIKNAISMAREEQGWSDNLMEYVYTDDEIIQSIQKPKEFYVEIEIIKNQVKIIKKL